MIELPAGSPVALGPRENKIVILLHRVIGSRIHFVVGINQLTHILFNSALRSNGEIVV